MMQSGSHSQRNTNSKGVSYIQHNTQPSKELNKQLFNQIETLVHNHDVTVSSTMIKFTYNKGMKDHSITSASGNEFGSKRHSVSYNPSHSDAYNRKLSIGSGHHNKSFNNIVFIPKSIAVARSNGTTVIKKDDKGYQGLINEGKLYITPTKKIYKEDIQKIKNNSLSCLYNKEYHLKQLKIHLTKMNTSMTQASSKSHGSVNHVIDNYQNHQNNSTSEVSSRKLVKSDGHKCINENKGVTITTNSKIQTKKEKVKHNESNDLEKERLKSVKRKNENFKKKRSASSDDSNVKTKKFKGNSDISDKEVKEKGTTSKDKEKKVNVNNKEKKTPVKALNSSHMRDVTKRELLREDPTLPPGWRRIIKGKYTGDEFKPVICISSPEGRKFYFKAKLQEYLKKTNSHLTIDDFHFGLYEKGSKEKLNKDGNKKVNLDEKPIIMRSRKKKLEGGSQRQEPKRICLDKMNNVEDHTVEVKVKHQLDKGDNETGIVDKNVLLVDPGLPSGWVRKVRIKNGVEGPDKFQVWVISPEGRKFRRKYLLQRYLLKTGSPLDINQFYFGLYPRKDSTRISSASDVKKSSNSRANLSYTTGKDNEKFVSIGGRKYRLVEVESSGDGSISENLGGVQMSLILSKADDGAHTAGEQPLLEDPTLPPGWRRHIRVRSTGENGKLEVILVSPDGRKHSSKDGLKNYLMEKELSLNADNFDFTVFGRNSKKDSSCVVITSSVKPKLEGQIVRKRDSLLLPSDTSFPNLNLDHSSIYDLGKQSREALMINYVGGIMLNCGLRDLRSERRLRTPREEQEIILKKYLESGDVETVNDENEISTNWIQKLIHCRSDFGTLERDAARTLASLTKEFLQELTRHALEVSKNENRLEYGDLAEVVDKSECLSPLKALIPKKITFREFIRLNRPTKFSSFT